MNPTDPINPIIQFPTEGGQANVPGLRKLWLVEARHVMGLLDPRTLPGQLSGWRLATDGLQLGEDAVFQQFKFPAGRGDYEQKSAVTVQGVVYNHSLSLAVPRDHPQSALAIQRMAGRKWLAVTQDANGLFRLVGTPKQPLGFTFTQKSSPSGYVLSWTTQTRQPSYFLTDGGVLQTDADFSFGFSYDFHS